MHDIGLVSVELTTESSDEAIKLALEQQSVKRGIDEVRSTAILAV